MDITLTTESTEDEKKEHIMLLQVNLMHFENIYSDSETESFSDFNSLFNPFIF